MKHLLQKLLNKLVYASPELGLKIKQTVFRSHSEHLYKTIHLLKNKINYHSHSLIVDVGAYDGNTCIFWAKHFPHCQIIGFEPNPELKNVYTKNTKTYPNIKIFPCAIGNKRTQTTLYITENIPSSSLINPHISSSFFNKNNQYTVDVMPLDEISEIKSAQEILLFKLDAQGYEPYVLEGAVQTLKKTKVILTEMTNHNIYQSPSYFLIDEILRKNNFILYDIIPSLFAFDIHEYEKFGVHKNQLIEWDSIYINKSLL